MQHSVPPKQASRTCYPVIRVLQPCALLSHPFVPLLRKHCQCHSVTLPTTHCQQQHDNMATRCAIDNMATCCAFDDMAARGADNKLTELLDIPEPRPVHLRSLDARRNCLRTFYGARPRLSAFTNLEDIALDGNKLITLQGLGALSGLRRLSVAHNALKSIEGLEELLVRLKLQSEATLQCAAVALLECLQVFFHCAVGVLTGVLARIMFRSGHHSSNTSATPVLAMRLVNMTAASSNVSRTCGVFVASVTAACLLLCRHS